jgi:general secretion pathway protein A
MLRGVFLSLSRLGTQGVKLYQGFYKLKENPFRLSPDPAFMCMTSQHQEALSGLIYSVCTRPGLTLLLGEAGTGKTTLLYSLLSLLEKRRFVTAMSTNPNLTSQEFYDLLILKFGVQCDSPLKSRQLAALEATLRRNRADGRPSVLIVDEAQRLPAELLEETRLLLNLETPREKLLEIIMSGQPELGDVMQRPDLRQLKQRISCICKLRPLTQEEFKEYLSHRLTRAGLPNQTIFPETALELIYEYTQGIPRLINSLCDTALRTGFALQSPCISPSIVDEAARDLDLRRPFDVPDDVSLKIDPVLPSAAIPMNGHNDKNGDHGDRQAPDQIPLESYAARQRSTSFFANLLDRWK